MKENVKEEKNKNYKKGKIWGKHERKNLIVGECNSRKYQPKIGGQQKMKKKYKIGRKEIKWNGKGSRGAEQVKSFVIAIPYLKYSRKTILH
jgi:hypothetical protein